MVVYELKGEIKERKEKKQVQLLVRHINGEEIEEEQKEDENNLGWVIALKMICVYYMLLHKL